MAVCLEILTTGTKAMEDRRIFLLLYVSYVDVF
jgi:hypothetical protein